MVGPAIFNSAGQRSEHYVPGAYSRSAAIGGGGTGVSANRGVILGRAKGGQPGKLFNFATVNEAMETLVDGDLLKAVAHAFNPSPDYAPQAIRAMVVNGNTQARSVLKSGGREILRLKTASWGVIANSIARQIANGTNPGTKKITFTTTDDIESKTDNIGKKSIQLQYTGDGSSAILDINNIGLSVEVFKNDNRPSIDIDGLAKLRVGEATEFSISTTNPEGEAIDIVAGISLAGIEKSLLQVEFYETAGGVNTWQPLDISIPFKGPEGFPLTNGSVLLRITPLAGAENAIIEYKVTLYQVAGGVPTNNVIAQTTTGQTEIAAAGQPYSVYNIPAYDANSDSIFIAYEDYPTIEEVVRRLDGTGNFAVIQLEEAANVPSYELDYVDSIDIAMDAKTLTSNFYAFFHALENSPWIGRGNVEKVDGAPNLLPDNDADPVFFEGASAGTYTVMDWNKTLATLEAEDIQIISTPATDHAVQVLISNHCTAMSNVQNRKERTALFGGRIGETVEEAIENARAFGSKLVSYCYPAIRASSPLTGQAEDLPASYFACKLLGMECAVSVNEPLTWKTVGVLDYLTRLKVSEMEKLIIGGVLCGAETDDKRLAVIRAMTTYQGNQLQLVERSMVREDLYMNRDLRQRLSGGVGRPALDTGGDARGTLMGAARDWKGEGIIVPNDNAENIWGISIRRVGDKLIISFCRNLAAPQNFFFITAYNYVYEAAATYEV